MEGHTKDNGRTIEWTDMANFTTPTAKRHTKDTGFKTNSTAQAESITRFHRIKW